MDHCFVDGIDSIRRKYASREAGHHFRDFVMKGVV